MMLVERLPLKYQCSGQNCLLFSGDQTARTWFNLGVAHSMQGADPLRADVVELVRNRQAM